MKKFILFARVGLIVTVVFFQPAFGAPLFKSLSPEFPNYVVIGAFAVEKNAEKFTRQANAANHHAKFDINPGRKLYYVFVLTTSNRSEAVTEALRLRKETKYSDAWVYNGAIGTDTEQTTPGTDINPVSEKPIEEVSPQEQIESAVTQPVTDSVGADSESQLVNKGLTSETLSNEEIADKNFIFDLYRDLDGQKIEADIEVIDTEKSRKMGSYKGNVPVKITAPQTKSGKVFFVCEAFGYRKVQQEFTFKSTEGQNLSIDGDGNIVIPFELTRLKKGDIAVMYNVFFFVDAGVMRPESRFEVNSLLNMMKENPNCRIRIHGHTNGKASGKLITIGESKNFFSLTGTNEGYGSAKKLSEERASVIKQYLESNGIEGSRMEVKAWGGKKPIHDRHATRAQENVRVEVEILSN